MIKSAKPRGSKRPRYTREKILVLLQEFNKRDDLSVTGFCQQSNIHKATFYNWRKRYNYIKAEAPKGFLSVEVTAPASSLISSTPALFAEVNGIKLYHFVSADYLKALLA